MSTTITGVVTNGVVVPKSPLPKGTQRTQFIFLLQQSSSLEPRDRTVHLWHRRQRKDERKLALKIFDELVVGSDEFAALALGQGDIEAVVSLCFRQDAQAKPLRPQR